MPGQNTQGGAKRAEMVSRLGERSHFKNSKSDIHRAGAAISIWSEASWQLPSLVLARGEGDPASPEPYLNRASLRPKFAAASARDDRSQNLWWKDLLARGPHLGPWHSAGLRAESPQKMAALNDKRVVTLH
ncbi:hypothetical protein CPLU01_05331 [Colletotrichum plurivorum]|uniref:Uncharacterized protein n=1 Tax=Colletotrichum plurivorum TaxID=2175906 RepID=A0A8H6NI51_9PEZI|nr:hypothetical protein CPLU01_05331 [Colletotrichum plurivorum]